MSDAIEPFDLHVDDAVLDDLRRRLAATRFPDAVEGAGWDYGIELETLRAFVDYWANAYDWRAQEARLAAFDHFSTSIDGQRIHFLHARSKHENALPLIISHGWPGSIVEFLDVIEPLRDPESHGGEAGQAFHVVCPSLPGYGYSEPTRTRGWDTIRMADAFAVLMSRLGYDRYVAQGGDWGALVTTHLGARDPSCIAIHSNMPIVRPPEQPGELSASEQADLGEMAAFAEEETGYQRIQGTKPQSLGVGLNDSPAGLCAWILEKFRTWSDCEGDLLRSYTKDQLLTNVMLYWVNQTITSSTRLYYETMKAGERTMPADPVKVPTGIARFPKEMMRFPRSWVEASYHVTHWTEMPRGGHFAAMEEPELFVRDLRTFFGTVR